MPQTSLNVFASKSTFQSPLTSPAASTNISRHRIGDSPRGEYTYWEDRL